MSNNIEAAYQQLLIAAREVRDTLFHPRRSVDGLMACRLDDAIKVVEEARHSAETLIKHLDSGLTKPAITAKAVPLSERSQREIARGLTEGTKAAETRATNEWGDG